MPSLRSLPSPFDPPKLQQQQKHSRQSATLNWKHQMREREREKQCVLVMSTFDDDGYDHGDGNQRLSRLYYSSVVHSFTSNSSS